MVQQDIRWIQRFSNYRKALAKLSQAMAIMSEQLAFNDGVDELLQEGMIQRFEYTIHRPQRRVPHAGGTEEGRQHLQAAGGRKSCPNGWPN